MSERAFDSLAATEWTLSNGMRLCYKVTDFLDDEVLLTGFATGGLSDAPRDKHATAAMACIIADQVPTTRVCFGLLLGNVVLELLKGKRAEPNTSITGVASPPQHLLIPDFDLQRIQAQVGPYGHKPSVLSELLKGKRVEMEASESAYSRSVRGELSPVHLETALQLLHQLFVTK